MAITADKVVTILEVQDQAYLARLERDAQKATVEFGKIAAAADGMESSVAGAFNGVASAGGKAGKGLKDAGKGFKTVGEEGRMAQQQMRNLAFQFQDIGTMLAAGQSPFMLLAQQLPQVTMYGGQLTGVMGALKGTLAGLLSPLGLLTTTFVLATSGAISYFSGAADGAKSLNDILKEHEALIKSLGPAYEGALKAAKAYSESPEVAAALLADSADAAAKALGALVSDALKKINYALDQGVRDAMNEGISDLTEAYSESRFAPFYKVIERFADGAINAREFREEVTRMGNATPELAGAAQELRMIVNEAANATRAAADMADTITAVEHALNQLQAEIEKVTSEKAQKEVSDLAQKVIDGEMSIEDFKKAVASLSTSAPDLSSHISEFVRLIGVIRQAKAEAEGFSGRESQGGRVRYGTTGFMQLPGEVAATPTARVDPYFDDPITKKRGGSKRENEYQRLTKQIEARTKALQAETAAQAQINPLIEDYGYAAEKAKFEAQLLVAAEQAKIEITPSVKQAIEATAEGYAQATVAARKLAEEQREALRSAEEWLGVGRDVTQGFISDLLNGASAADSLANALRKVGDALINDILNNIFKINSAGSGGILSSILGFFGGGFRANTTAGAFFGAGTGVPQFAGGTNYAPGGLALVGEKGPELVNLPRGSQVIPNHRLNGQGGQSVVVNFNPVIDARGADPAAIARLETGLAKVRQEMPAQVVESVRKAQKSNVKLG